VVLLQIGYVVVLQVVSVVVLPYYLNFRPVLDTLVFYPFLQFLFNTVIYYFFSVGLGFLPVCLVDWKGAG